MIHPCDARKHRAAGGCRQVEGVALEYDGDVDHAVDVAWGDGAKEEFCPEGGVAVGVGVVVEGKVLVLFFWREGEEGGVQVGEVLRGL